VALIYTEMRRCNSSVHSRCLCKMHSAGTCYRALRRDPGVIFLLHMFMTNCALNICISKRH